MAKLGKHTGPHKYELTELTRLTRKPDGTHQQEVVNTVFKCMLPNCRHFMPQPELVLGQLSLCWGNCGNAVLLNRSHLRIKKPMCEACRARRKEIRERMKEIA